MNETTVVTLGEHEFRVLPQPHAYLAHHFPRVFADIKLDDATDVAGFIRTLGHKIYDVLSLLLPPDDEGNGLSQKLPAHAFRGFASQEAMDAGDYDEDAARRSPTLPQIGDALETCVKVNWGESLTRLIDPLELLSGAVTLSQVTSSPSSPSTNGASRSTSSGAPAPTPTSSGSE